MVKTNRLDGLDLARFIAFVGMVIVNFGVVMGVEKATGGIGLIFELAQGKAAATFVVLAGVGVGLAGFDAKNMVVRSAFLLVIGLLNMLIFPADIIHYYAVYFLFAIPFMNTRFAGLIVASVLVVLAGAASIIMLDYDAGWDWTSLDYADFWSVSGFLRNLLFNGWHPVLPWLAFLLFGMALSRLDLSSARTQMLMVVVGAVFIAAAVLLSKLLIGIVNDEQLTLVLGTSPIPPMPLYMLIGTGSALLVIGVCLWLADRFAGLAKPFNTAGKQTLTLYFAHILIGMGAIELFGFIENGTALQAFGASVLFSLLALLFANLWAKKYRRGPLELLMRYSVGKMV